ncbi:MAG: hypothetical protein VX498_14230 [Myxococcota bacterium]|nr:hypothetical protein [Myxococcota bacterium]
MTGIDLRPVCFLAIGALVLLSGCPKTGSTSGSGETAVQAESKSRFQGVTREFVEALIGSSVLGWTVDASGVPVVYDELRFQEDGRFEARASVRLGGGADTFECTERGSWELDGDRAESPREGNLRLDISHTDCAGRESPPTMKARAVIGSEETQLTVE